jgi:tRNA nucleotidyltransferase (CCA-adding enzyme)
VGGCVRDLLRGSRTFDLDFAAHTDGIALAEAVAKRLGARLVSHRRFGTATLAHGELKIDIATMRKEVYPQPAHLPVVEPGQVSDDLFRRDFTINAMALDVSRDGCGCLIDTYGGKQDLAKGLVRVLHDASFMDDPTRIIRAIRFEQRYGFRIEPHTLQLLKEASRRRMLSRVDPQRLRDELILLLKEDTPRKALERLHALTGLSFLSKGLRFSKKSEAFLVSIERQIAWFKRSNAHRRVLDAWLLYLIGLCDSLSGRETARFAHTLALRRGEIIRILSYKNRDKRALLSLKKKTVSPSTIYRLFEPLSYEVILAIKAAHPHARVQRHIEDFFEIYNDIRVSISGNDIRSLGVSPGPVYKTIFAKVLAAKVNGEIHSRADELTFIRRYLCARKRE